MEIITATETDVPVIKKLAEQIWWPTYGNILSDTQIEFMLQDMYSEQALKAQMNSGNTFILVSRGDEIVAFAGYSLTNDSLRIHKLYVLPSEQGKGTGKELVSHLGNVALEKGLSYLELNVNRNNPALAFYQKTGFQVIDTVDIPYHQFVLNDYVMQKPLSPTG